MKQTLALLALAALLLPSATFADSCSCIAPDASCSASISCPSGCTAVCVSGGSCSSSCGGGSGSGWHPWEQNLEEAPKGSDRMLSLNAQSLTATDLSEVLSQSLGGAVEFVPLDPEALYSLDVSRMAPGELVAVLSKFGAVATAGHERRQGAATSEGIPEAEVSIKLERTTAGEVATLLGRFLSDAGYLLRATDPQEELSLEVEHMSLEDLLQSLEATTSMRIVRVER